MRSSVLLSLFLFSQTLGAGPIRNADRFAETSSWAAGEVTSITPDFSWQGRTGTLTIHGIINAYTYDWENMYGFPGGISPLPTGPWIYTGWADFATQSTFYRSYFTFMTQTDGEQTILIGANTEYVYHSNHYEMRLAFAPDDEAYEPEPATLPLIAAGIGFLATLRSMKWRR